MHVRPAVERRRDEVVHVPASKVAQVQPSAIPTLMLPAWSGVEMRGGQVTRVVEWGDESGSVRLIVPDVEDDGDDAWHGLPPRATYAELDDREE